MSSSSPSSSAQYDMRLNPCYQIDCVAASSGKVVAATKRRVRFRFGFSDAKAIASGLSGVDCRGSEHEVTFVWSLTSGKRLVLLDGTEVHFSKGKIENKFETSWTMMPGHHQLKIVAHAAPPNGVRQFDLHLDGMSFFSMPHLYQLGSTCTASSMRPSYINSNTFPPQEESAWSRNVHAHEDRRSMRDPPAATAIVPTMDILSDPIPNSNTYNSSNGTSEESLLNQQIVSDSSESATSTLGTLSSSSYDEFAPVLPAPPTMNTIHHQIMGAYGGPTTTTNNNNKDNKYTKSAPPPLAITSSFDVPPPQYVTPTYANNGGGGGDGVPQTVPNPQNGSYGYEDTIISPASNVSTPSTFSPEQQQQPQQYYYQSQHQQQYQTPAVPTNTTVSSQEEENQYPQLTMAPTTYNNDSQEQEEKSDVDRAMKSLVNLEDITQDAEFQKEHKLTMFQQKQKVKKNKSQPLAPVTGGWNLGPKPTLGDIKATSTKRQGPPTKEIMKPNVFHSNAGQAGMMVVYGANTGTTRDGPPPLAQHEKGSVGMGFGVGATMRMNHQPQQYYAY